MASKTYKQGILLFCVLAFSIVAWVVLLHYISPEEIVEKIGIKNGYLIMFLIALFGGVSTFTGVSYVATVLTLASGGLNPFYLALSSGIGITLSDTLFFWLGRHAEHVIHSKRLKLWVTELGNWLEKKSRWVVGLFIYIYTGFTPLPNDLLTIILGLTKQPYWYVIVWLTLGNVTFTFLLATVGGNFIGF